MKKFPLVVGGLIFILSLTLVWQLFGLNSTTSISADAEVVEVQMRVLQDKWEWSPEEIVVPLGSLVRLNIFNEDSYDHGFAISELGIDQRVAANKNTVVEFLAEKEGEYTFYCSILCGQGHFEQTGKLIIR